MYWRNALPTLQDLVNKPRLGLITDMDGTLSPIVPSPDAAQVTPRNLELLQALRACLALVAVVSGRGAADLRARVGLPGLVYIGNHGMERWCDGHVEYAPGAEAYRAVIQAALEKLRLQQVGGMLIEDKAVTISVHYRQTTNPDAVAETFRPVVQRIAQAHGLKTFEGRRIFEIRPPVHIDKGTALQSLVETHALDAAVYLGDDTTDADALLMARRLRDEAVCYALGVGIEATETPSAVVEAADLLVEGVSDVEAFLAWLLKARKASSICA